MSYFERPEFKMHYEVHPGLVQHDTLFYHGNLASNRWWQPALQVWQERQRRSGKKLAGSLIFAEWRGCGRSSAPQNEADLAVTTLAADYLALMDHLKLGKVSIVGHSTGCLLALLNLATAPSRFDRAVLLDPVNHRGVTFPPEGLEAFKMMASDRSFCQTVMASTIHQVNVDDPHFQQLVDDSFGVAPLIWTGIPAALHGLDFTAEMKKIKHPILILHGSEDPILPIAGSRELADVLPNAQMVELKGHGHSFNVEDPSGFVTKVNEFLGL